MRTIPKYCASGLPTLAAPRTGRYKIHERSGASIVLR